MTKRIYAAVKTECLNESVRVGLRLLGEFITKVSGGHRPAILDAITPSATNLALQAWADAVNNSTNQPVEISTGSHRTMTWLEQRVSSPSGHARLTIHFYWDRPAFGTRLLVSLEGDLQTMSLATLDTLWYPANENYVAGNEAMRLDDAITCAADHM